jgi:DNA-binding GntR family transcriptional regulator
MAQTTRLRCAGFIVLIPLTLWRSGQGAVTYSNGTVAHGDIDELGSAMGAVELVYTVLRQGILDGTYEEGTRLGEVELATSLKVSRTPVREALRRLLSDGLIETVPNQGSRVRRWDPAQLVELFSVRALLEANSAGLAAARVTEEDFSLLRKLCKQMEAAARSGPKQDLERVAALDNEFHQMIHLASGSSLLPSLIRGLVQIPVVMRAAMDYPPKMLSQMMRQHQEIVGALRTGDAAWAEAAMRSHVLSARPGPHVAPI